MRLLHEMVPSNHNNTVLIQLEESFDIFFGSGLVDLGHSFSQHCNAHEFGKNSILACVLLHLNKAQNRGDKSCHKAQFKDPLHT